MDCLYEWGINQIESGDIEDWSNSTKDVKRANVLKSVNLMIDSTYSTGTQNNKCKE